MSKINQAIHEIQTMDSMANEDRWVNHIHPLVKLFLTVYYVTVVVSFSKYDLTGLSGMVVYPLILFNIGEISFRDALRRLRVVLPVVCIIGVLNPFFDRNIVTVICHIPISGGVISMLSLFLKGVLTVLASYLLIATTSIEKICYALRLLHLPKIFVTQIMLIYRYINVLLAEANRVTSAYSLRAPRQKGVQYKVWGTLVGQLLLHSMDRAENLYESMCLRGYQGEFYYGLQIRCRKSDLIYLLIWVIVIALFRILPLIQFIGNLFV